MADSTAIQVIHDTIIINREIIIDSTRVIHDTVVVNTVSDYDILNRVDSFYNSAFTILIVVISIIATIIGVIIPLVIQSYQRRRYNQDMKAIENAQKDLKAEIDNATQKLNKDFKNEMEETKEELTKVFEAQLKEKFDNADEKLYQIDEASYAHLHHLQGTIYYTANHYSSALFNFIKATKHSINSKIESHIKSSAINITKAIEKLDSYKVFVDAEKEANTTISSLIQGINSFKNDDFQKDCIDIIKNIEEAIEKLKARSNDTEEQKDENENPPSS